MTQAVPIWISRMTVAFLPTYNSAMQAWSGHRCHHPLACPALGHCHLPRDRGSCSECVLPHTMYYERTRWSFPASVLTPKYTSFSFCVCCLEMLGFFVILYASPIANIWFLSALSLTNLIPASFGVCASPELSTRDWQCCSQHILPTKKVAHTEPHPHPHQALREKAGANSACCPWARQVWNSCERTSVSSLERLMHQYDL